MKKIISICLLLLTVFSMSSIGMTDVQAAETKPFGTSVTEPTPYAAIKPTEKPESIEKGVILDVHEVALKVGETFQLHPTIIVPEGETADYTFDIENSDIIDVSDTGLITALKPGASGTACLLHGKWEYSDICWVTVMFNDVTKSDAYYYDPVYWAVATGITTGYTDKSGKPTGYFGPNDQCTRGQIVTFLYRWTKYWGEEFRPDTSGVSDFSDVKSTSYCYNAVKWAVAMGITTGYTDKNGKPTGKFGPDDICTRAQIVTFLYRMLSKYWYPYNPEVTEFSDVKEDTFYYDAVQWAVGVHLTTGYTGTDKFGPDDKCTRGQVVTFLYRAD